VHHRSPEAVFIYCILYTVFNGVLGSAGVREKDVYVYIHIYCSIFGGYFVVVDYVEDLLIGRWYGQAAQNCWCACVREIHIYLYTLW